VSPQSANRHLSCIKAGLKPLLQANHSGKFSGQQETGGSESPTDSVRKASLKVALGSIFESRLDSNRSFRSLRLRL
jgi:hypothetical protein